MSKQEKIEKKMKDEVAVFIDGSYLYHLTKKLDVKIDFFIFRSLLNQVFGESSIYYYSPFNPEAKHYRLQQSFLDRLSNSGYKVKKFCLHKVKSTGVYVSSMETQFVIDVLSISQKCNRIVLVSGDSDFLPLIQALKKNGKEVILLGLPISTKMYLRKESSRFWNIEKFLTQINNPEIFKKIKPPIKIQDTTKQLYFEKDYYFDSYVKIRNILKSATKSVTIIDNYIDEEILDLVAVLDRSIQFKIISKKQPKNKDFFVMLKKLKREGRGVFFYLSPQFHDRFIRIDEKWWHLGHSIKDLGSGDAMLSNIFDHSIIDKLQKKEEEVTKNR